MEKRDCISGFLLLKKKIHELGYAHLDAHKGNFLILKSGKVIIHDFGTTVPVSKLNIKLDYDTFQDHFHTWHTNLIEAN